MEMAVESMKWGILLVEWLAASDDKMQCELNCLLLLKEETTPGLQAGIFYNSHWITGILIGGSQFSTGVIQVLKL